MQRGAICSQHADDEPARSNIAIGVMVAFGRALDGPARVRRGVVSSAVPDDDLSGLLPLTIEAATIDDLPALVEMYNDSLATSNWNFGTRPVAIGERRAWFSQFGSAGPHRLLVARSQGVVLGYASAARYRDREAFRETVEVSVSLRAGWRSRGVGTLLYASLFDALAGEAVHVALAGIALPNDASLALHRKFAFTDVGTFREYAIKDGRYISSVWMQRLL
jgi:phosphinothricin acetyltransferase